MRSGLIALKLGMTRIYTVGGADRGRDPADALPEIVIPAEPYGRLARLLAKNLPVTIEADIRNTYFPTPPMFNVVGEIPGTDKADEIVMLGGPAWAAEAPGRLQRLAQKLAGHNRVLYINMPLDINTVLKGFDQPEVQKRLRVLAGQAESLVQGEPNVWVLTPRVLGISINWVSSRGAFANFSRAGNASAWRSVRHPDRLLHTLIQAFIACPRQTP